MGIREHTNITPSTKAEQQQTILDAIEELRQQYADGVMSPHAYQVKMRALVRML